MTAADKWPVDVTTTVTTNGAASFRGLAAAAKVSAYGWYVDIDNDGSDVTYRTYCVDCYTEHAGRTIDEPMLFAGDARAAGQCDRCERDLLHAARQCGPLACRDCAEEIADECEGSTRAGGVL